MAVADPPLVDPSVAVIFRQGASGQPEVVVTVEGEDAATCVVTWREANATATPAP